MSDSIISFSLHRIFVDDASEQTSKGSSGYSSSSGVARESAAQNESSSFLFPEKADEMLIQVIVPEMSASSCQQC